MQFGSFMKTIALPLKITLNVRFSLRCLGVIGIALVTANCASNRSKVDPKYGVAPSPQKYGENDNIPKGGGRYQTGKPYTIAGRVYVPQTDATGYKGEGVASWYGPGFHGRKTANGEYFDQHSFTAAHTTLPLPSYVRVTNMENKRSIIVRVNDRGPFAHDRVIDLSQKTAEALEFKHKGTANVRVEYIGKASVDGSDDNLLLASLTTDGSPAELKGYSEPVMVAELSPQAKKLPSQALAFNDQPIDDDQKSVLLRTGDTEQPQVAVAVASDTSEQ